jgi:hypothetical protein
VAFIMSWQAGGDEADRGMALLAGFRGELYCSLGLRRDALFEACDARACRPERVHMPAELCPGERLRQRNPLPWTSWERHAWPCRAGVGRLEIGPSKVVKPRRIDKGTLAAALMSQTRADEKLPDPRRAYGRPSSSPPLG